jgi:nitrate reductase NapAB chaperone NapD
LKGRVLIIDDEAEIRRNLTIGLTQEEYTVVACPPFEISDLVAALNELSPGKTETDSVEESIDDGIRESVSGYLTVKITDSDRSMEIYDSLYKMEGIQSCDAVRGDFDIILLVQASSTPEIREIFSRIKNLEGIEVVSMSEVERPKLDRDVDQFIETYQIAVKREVQAEARRQPGTMSYIIVDIDSDAIQQIFTTVFFIDEVVFCDVIEDGSKLVGMITGHGAMGKTPRIIEKLSQIDGVLRVREAKVIKLIED